MGLRVSTLIFILLRLTSDVSNKVCILQINLACRNTLSKREESVVEDHSEQETSANNKTIRNRYSVMYYVYSNTKYRAKFRLKLTGIKINFVLQIRQNLSKTPTCFYDHLCAVVASLNVPIHTYLMFFLMPD